MPVEMPHKKANDSKKTATDKKHKATAQKPTGLDEFWKTQDLQVRANKVRNRQALENDEEEARQLRIVAKAEFWKAGDRNDEAAAAHGLDGCESISCIRENAKANIRWMKTFWKVGELRAQEVAARRTKSERSRTTLSQVSA